MGGRLIRWWWGERRDTESDWFTIWIFASTNVQSWRFLLGLACHFNSSLSPCVHMCAYLYMHVCELLSWWETAREGMCMVGLQLNHRGLCLDQGHLTTAGVAAWTEPCKTNYCHGDCESYSFYDIITHTLFTLCAVVALLAHAVRASMKISQQREQRVLEDMRGGCKRVCVNLWHCDLL